MRNIRLTRLVLTRVVWLVGAFTLALAKLDAAERPNILWILSEDSSHEYLRLYDSGGAATPRIEQLAAHGVVFDQAFSNAPVCSVARTTLMSGLYAPRALTQFHRCLAPSPLAAGWRLFPHYLREAGYHTSNNAKKDYNCVEGAGVWDVSSKNASWRERPSPDTPFFHMRTLTTSHESSLHFTPEELRRSPPQASPAEQTLAPYHPDTPLFRATRARYLDRITQIDAQVGELVDELARDGLLERTFIFYFGDHGGVLPRSKGYLYESGLHVPLVVRVPERWRALVDRELGSRTAGFVSFVDFAPTMLALAGVPSPAHLDGRAFLGESVRAAEVDARDEAFGYADRFDERYDLTRSLRKGRYKYLRSFWPFYPDASQNNYRYQMLAYDEWRTLHQRGELDATRDAFFQPRSPEALYDLESDPHETRNLAGDPAHAETLARLRGLLQQRLRALPDLSLLPESELMRRALEAPIEFGERRRDELTTLLGIADLELLPFPEARPRIERALADDDPWRRYWGLIVCTSHGESARPLVPRAQELLEDPQPLVRVRAAEFLGAIGAADPVSPLLDMLRTCDNAAEALLALNTVVHLRDSPRGYRFDLPAGAVRVESLRPRPGDQVARAALDGVQRRLAYLRGQTASRE